MKIYQLHEYGGEYEDFRDYIIGSYLRKERAEEEKAKAEAEEQKIREQACRCSNCPFVGEKPAKLKTLLAKHKGYCEIMKLDAFGKYGIVCENYFTHWDNMYFEIQEVEVEE